MQSLVHSEDKDLSSNFSVKHTCTSDAYQNFSELWWLALWRYIFSSNTAAFFRPGPPNLGLSKHILHLPQSIVVLQPLHMPQPVLLLTRPVMSSGNTNVMCLTCHYVLPFALCSFSNSTRCISSGIERSGMLGSSLMKQDEVVSP